MLDGAACEIDGNPFGIAEAPVGASASTPNAAAAASVCLRCVMGQFLLSFFSRRPNQRRIVENRSDGTGGMPQQAQGRRFS
jgi:hypothetical protein